MGFISTGNTLNLTAYLTQRGRDLLLNGSESDITGAYFALGDSDTNYTIELRNDQGFVPDLTGDNLDCIFSLADNVGIHDFVYSVDGDPTVPPVTPPVVTSEVRLKRTDDGKYYNVLDCVINLDSIGRYMLYHSADNTGNATGAYVNNALLPIFTNLFTQVDLLTTPTDSPDSTQILAVSDFDFNLQFDASNYRSLINTYLDGDTTVVQTGDVKSPIVMAFSSRTNTTGTFKGAGTGGVGIHGREIGYMFKDYNGTAYSFFNANLVEGGKDYIFFTDENNQLINEYTLFTLAARIYAKNVNTGSVEALTVRGDQNLANVSDTKMSTFSNDLKHANQHLKLFKNTAGSAIVNNALITGVGVDGMGIVQKEMLNLRDFVELSPLFIKTAGTNEYRTSKLTFNVYPKGNTSVNPATLNIVFKYNEDVLLSGDTSYLNITTPGDLTFISYDFVATNGVFKNNYKTAAFVKACATGSNGTTVNYVVLAGKYTASTQAGADALAQADIDANGQNYANTNGVCNVATIYYSAAYAGYVTRNNCPAGYTPSTTYVSVVAGQYSSTLSQYDANIQASNQAQVLANNQSSCTIITSTGGGGGCLVSGQKILVDDQYNTILVEDIKAGDEIYTAHETTQVLGKYKVLSAVAEPVGSWYKVTTEDNKEIKCSPTHLFMIDGVKKVVSNLQVGEDLMVLNENKFEPVKIKSIDIYYKEVVIHKIEVEDAHTYITENMIYQHNLKAPSV